MGTQTEPADPGRRSENAPEWYADGLRFECTQCGNCCTGPPGYVSFTDDEAQAMARKLGLPPDEFLARYTRPDEQGGRSLLEVETEHGHDCIFLDRATTPGSAVCTLYEARPLQCRTFPWWPDALRSRRSWHRTARECEGIGRGPVVALQTIRIARDAQRSRDGSVSRS